MGPSGSISCSMLPILFWQCLPSIRIVRHSFFCLASSFKFWGLFFFFLKNRFFVKCPSPCALTGTFSHALYFNYALFLSSMMCYNVPGLSGILDFSCMSWKKRASIFAYSARKTVKTVFPCSLRSS